MPFCSNQAEEKAKKTGKTGGNGLSSRTRDRLLTVHGFGEPHIFIAARIQAAAMGCCNRPVFRDIKKRGLS
jgi:hypothetical protein